MSRDRALPTWSAKECLDRLRLDVSEGRVAGMGPLAGAEVKPKDSPRSWTHRPRDKWCKPPAS